MEHKGVGVAPWGWAQRGREILGCVPAPVLIALSLQLRAQVGAGCCLSVNCALKAQQQAQAVLRHFNVRVTQADIFTRCQVGPGSCWGAQWEVEELCVPGWWGAQAMPLSFGPWEQYP